MKKGLIRSILAATAMLVSANLALAVDATVKTPDVKGAVQSSADSTKAGVKGTAADTKAAAKSAKEKAKGAAADTKTAAKGTLVDINTASEAELKAVPGIGDTYAAKIIAGRPYANKAQLKSRNILPGPAYDKVHDQIIAKQPAKDAAKAATKPVKK